MLIDGNKMIGDLKTMQTHDGMIRGIEQQPIVDAVPVVRCKECRYGETLCNGEGVLYCAQWDTRTSENGYCHKNEKKNGGASDV